ncbi:MAG: sulfatase [Opitutaceae bacterium]
MRILYIDIDALRPDHLGCYGYHRETSPNIDAIAREGMRFNQYYCSDAPCLPSRTALYTGMFGIHSGVVGHGGTAADPRIEGPERGFRDRIESDALATRLNEAAGLHTAQISPFGHRHAARQFLAGFNEIHNTGKGGIESAGDVQPILEKWLSENASRDNWYLHVNYWDVHTPYRVPKEYPCPFEDVPIADWLSEEILTEHRRHPSPHGACELGMFTDANNCHYPRELGELKNLDDLTDWINGYDTAIRYVDDHVGRIVQCLKESGVYEDTVIIITADHGENQGELGIYGEHGTADAITCRVPMIVKGPDVVRGGTDDGLHYQIDLAPTLAEWLRFDAPASWDGSSFLASLQHAENRGREFLVLSQCAHVCQRAVRFGDHIYIRTYHDGFRLFPREMLFDLEKDPHEQHDLAKQHPELCNLALRYLSDWHDALMEKSGSDVDPLWTVIREGGPFHARGQLRAYIERLEATGRGYAVPELKRRHPRELE